MTTPDKGVEDVRVETEEKEEPKPEEKKEVSKFGDRDPRKAIYEKADALKRAKEEEEAKSLSGPKEEEPEEEPEKEAATTEPPSPEKTADAEEVKEAATVFTREELLDYFKDVRIKGKIDGKDVEAPIADWIKATGLESKLTRKAQELSAKERELTAREKEFKAQFDAAKKAPESPTKISQLTEEQVQSRYDELVLESPYKAQKFLDEVRDARFQAEQQTMVAKVETALRDFQSTYPEVTAEDWIRMNDESFITKYPDIVTARNRAVRTGDHFATFVAARARLMEEKLSERNSDATRKETEKEAELRKRTEAKKKGQVVRIQTKVETQPKKEEEPKAESREEYVRRVATERRVKMGLGTPLRK